VTNSSELNVCALTRAWQKKWQDKVIFLSFLTFYRGTHLSHNKTLHFFLLNFMSENQFTHDKARAALDAN
jgi:uncharacterized membrane protein YesL